MSDDTKDTSPASEEPSSDTGTQPSTQGASGQEGSGGETGTTPPAQAKPAGKKPGQKPTTAQKAAAKKAGTTPAQAQPPEPSEPKAAAPAKPDGDVRLFPVEAAIKHDGITYKKDGKPMPMTAAQHARFHARGFVAARWEDGEPAA